MPKIIPVNPVLSAESGQSNSLTPEQYVQNHGGELQKQQGRVYVRVFGSVEVMGRELAYAVVPSRGVLAKAGKWRNMTPSQQLALVAERVNVATVESLQRQVFGFAVGFARRAAEFRQDPFAFLAALAESESSDPVEMLFQSLQQRLEHASEKAREEMHIAATRDSIRLAEYPASFELAYRLPRRFIALLGPTNSVHASFMRSDYKGK